MPNLQLVDGATRPRGFTMGESDPDSSDSHPATGGPLAEAIRALVQQQKTTVRTIERGIEEIKTDLKAATAAGVETASEVGRLKDRVDRAATDINALANENRRQEERLRAVEQRPQVVLPEKLDERLRGAELSLAKIAGVAALGATLGGGVCAAVMKLLH